jgi:hypothetical protein
MAVDRRAFLAAGVALAAAQAPGARAWASVPAAASNGPSPEEADARWTGDAAGGPHYLAARRHDDSFEAVLLDARGHLARTVPLPARGHSFAIDAARGRAVAFGRQAGFYATAFALHGKTPARTLPLPADRHFFGHGVFSDDGRLLFATENDFEAGRGVLGVYDASPGGAYRRVGEFDSDGVGPHEVVLMPDGRTLCVANGGILTHPDYGKLELNLDTMAPSLVYLDLQDGRVVDRVTLPATLHRLSIRHLAVAADGAVWFGMQYSGPAQDRPPLVGRHRRGQSAAELFPGPSDILRRLRNYVGSLSTDAAGAVVAASSPVGGLVTYWNANDGAYMGCTDIADGCGVAPAAGNGFLVSSGEGALLRAGPGLAPTLLDRDPATAWDNHFRRVDLKKAYIAG